MYSTLIGLSYQSEKELTDPAHIAGLVQFRDHMPLVVPVAFAVGGIASSVAAIIVAKVLWKIVPANPGP